MPNWWRRWSSGILLASSVGLGTVYFIQVNEAEQTAKCQAALNQAFIENIVKRSEFSRQSEEAKNRVLLGVSELVALPPTFDAKEQAKRSKRFVKIFTDYKAEVAEVEEMRKANPYPPLDNGC